MEEKSKKNYLLDSAIFASTRILADQKEKPESDRLNYFMVFDMINEELKSILIPSTVCKYVKKCNIISRLLKRR